ncbi:hypothetical protein [Methylorubrum populi]|uniref:hypothetical protein n=1 Tax=Methylorubrum populi TaxID=223967 RepID=UPI003F65C8ED
MGSRIRLVAAGGELVPGAIEVRLGKCILGEFQPRAKWRTGTAFVRQRLAEIERIIQARHGDACDTDDGEAYLEVALPHLVALPADAFPTSPVLLWAWSRVPRLVEVLGREWLEAAEVQARAAPVRLKADTIAERLGVRDEERSRLKLRTIGAIDRPAAKRKADAKAKALVRNRERKRRLREEERLKAAPKAPSISSLKPWQAEGISRSTWYAKRAHEAVGQLADVHSSEASNARPPAVRSSAA